MTHFPVALIIYNSLSNIQHCEIKTGPYLLRRPSGPLAPASSCSSSARLGQERESLGREPSKFVRSDVAGDRDGVEHREALKSQCSSVLISSNSVGPPVLLSGKERKVSPIQWCLLRQANKRTNEQTTNFKLTETGKARDMLRMLRLSS